MPTEFDKFWWSQPEGDVHRQLFNHVSGIENNQSAVHEANLWHASLYSNREAMAIDWGSWGVSHPDVARPIRPVHYNLIQSACDTATSIIAKSRPRAAVMTDGANFTLIRQAKKLDRFLLGLFQGQKLWDKATLSFRDATIFGTGFVKWSINDVKNTLECERIMPDEIIVDERTCICTEPMEMHHRKVVDRQVAIAMFPEHKDKLIQSQPDDFQYVEFRRPTMKHIILIESWRLPSAGKPGRHVIAADNVTILDESWEMDMFPIARYTWSHPIAGYYGQGIAEQLAGIQLQINKLNRFIDRAQHLVAVPRFIVHQASGVKPEHITNAEGGIVTWRGNVPPSVWTGQAIGPETFRRIDDLIRSGFEFIGVSQLRAQSQKPAGLESGKALREFNDIQSDRFAVQVQMYERFILDSAHIAIMLAKKAHQGGVNLYSSWRDGRVAKQIKWSDVNLEDDKFVLKIEAASMLTKTPAGRQSDVADLIRSGYIKPEDAPRLINHPDLDKQRELDDADWDDATTVVENLLDGKPVEAPENFQNLTLLLDLVRKNFLLAKNQGAPEEILMGMRNYMAVLKLALDQIQAEEAERAAMQQATEQAQQQPAGPPLPAEGLPTLQ